jgi:hypothetical protein
MCRLGERYQHDVMVLMIRQGFEIASSFIARQIMIFAFDIDVSEIGLNEMREYPELGQYFSLTRRLSAHNMVSAGMWVGSGPCLDERLTIPNQTKLPLELL